MPWSEVPLSKVGTKRGQVNRCFAAPGGPDPSPAGINLASHRPVLAPLPFPSASPLLPVTLPALLNPVYPLAVIAGVVVLATLAGALIPFYRRELAVEDRTRSGPLDGLRGVLCFAVLCHHAMVTFSFLGTGRWQVPPTHFYWLLGRTPVALFFCVTAFLFWSRAVAQGGELPAPFFFAGAVLPDRAALPAERRAGIGRRLSVHAVGRQLPGGPGHPVLHGLPTVGKSRRRGFEPGQRPGDLDPALRMGVLSPAARPGTGRPGASPRAPPLADPRGPRGVDRTGPVRFLCARGAGRLRLPATRPGRLPAEPGSGVDGPADADRVSLGHRGQLRLSRPSPDHADLPAHRGGQLPFRRAELARTPADGSDELQRLPAARHPALRRASAPGGGDARAGEPGFVVVGGRRGGGRASSCWPAWARIAGSSCLSSGWNDGGAGPGERPPGRSGRSNRWPRRRSEPARKPCGNGNRPARRPENRGL